MAETVKPPLTEDQKEFFLWAQAVSKRLNDLETFILTGSITLGDIVITETEITVGGSNLVLETLDAGTITAKLGTIGGWTLTDTTIYSTNITLNSANSRITANTIDIDGANTWIKSANYVSGYAGAGFMVSPGLAEFGNIAARGIIRTAVFQKDVVSAIGGSIFLRPSDVLDADMTALDASTLTIEGNETFSVGDFLRIKDGTDDEWLEVTNVGSAPTYTVTRDKDAQYAADTNPVWKIGASVVNYGASGDGGVYIPQGI